MKKKKIIFKLENDDASTQIDGVNTVELLAFICNRFENLIKEGVVSREMLLTSLNMCLALGTSLSKEELENKEIRQLMEEISDTMLDLFRGLKNE